MNNFNLTPVFFCVEERVFLNNELNVIIFLMNDKLVKYSINSRNFYYGGQSSQLFNSEVFRVASSLVEVAGQKSVDTFFIFVTTIAFHLLW